MRSPHRTRRPGPAHRYVGPPGRSGRCGSPRARRRDRPNRLATSWSSRIGMIEPPHSVLPPRKRFRQAPFDQRRNVRRSSCCVPTDERLHWGRLLSRSDSGRGGRRAVRTGVAPVVRGRAASEGQEKKNTVGRRFGRSDRPKPSRINRLRCRRNGAASRVGAPLISPGLRTPAGNATGTSPVRPPRPGDEAGGSRRRSLRRIEDDHAGRTEAPRGPAGRALGRAPADGSARGPGSTRRTR